MEKKRKKIVGWRWASPQPDGEAVAAAAVVVAAVVAAVAAAVAGDEEVVGEEDETLDSVAYHDGW